MGKKEEARKFLEEMELPEAQQADVCVYTLLALANIKNRDEWISASNEWIRIHDIIQFAKTYGITYAENSRETIRKQALHHFRLAAIVEDNGLATNSPNYRYRLTEEAKKLLQTFKSPRWEAQLKQFKQTHETLINIYASKKNIIKMPVKINQANYTFSPGKHNQLQKAILEEFAPRFAPHCECVYVGDTINKNMVEDNIKLQELGFEITQHDKMPDVVLYKEDKNWIYFIEAVTSVGPMNPKRIEEIKAMTKNVVAGKIFITAFLDFSTFKKFSEDLAWETEVWISEMPDHMIHLNGDKFMGPR